jgi:hypothetical protein
MLRIIDGFRVEVEVIQPDFCTGTGIQNQANIGYICQRFRKGNGHMCQPGGWKTKVTQQSAGLVSFPQFDFTTVGGAAAEKEQANFIR